MDFSSDTSAAAHPAVMTAIQAANEGSAPSYGADHWSRRARELLGEVFETEVAVWLVASGTAANALGLSLLCPSTDAVLCHREAHIEKDERGAVTFYSGGGQLALVDGDHGRISAETLSARLDQNRREFVHETPVSAVSISNLTEAGTAYTAGQIGGLSEIARSAEVRFHLDGARFANAVASTGDTAASLSWRAGVDVMSFGGTKNGAVGCEAVILFGDLRERQAELGIRAKRAGMMPPKMRFIAAQMCALLEGGLWLDLARRANAAAVSLAQILQSGGGELVHPVDGNEVFARLPEGLVAALTNAGGRFYPWADGSYRFVCAWSTRDEELDAVAAIVGAE